MDDRQYQCADAQREPRRYRIIRRSRELAAAAAWPVKCFYWRYFYQPHMKLIHRHGRHQFRLRGEHMGWPHLYCGWCGEIVPLAKNPLAKE